MDMAKLAVDFNINEICRLCMGRDLNFLPLFDQENSICGKIMTIIPILRLSSNDGLPEQVCSQCVNQVNLSYSFKMQCENSDVTLRRLVDVQLQCESDVASIVKEESEIVKEELEYSGVPVDCRALECRSSDEQESNVIVKTENENVYISNSNLKEDLSSQSEENFNSGTTDCERSKQTLKSKKSTSKTRLLKKKEKKFCNNCQKGFGTLADWSRHMQIHQGEKKGYSCEFCGKYFILKSILHAHYKLHPNEKPFSCEKCGEKFLTHVNLRTHRRIHLEKRICDICGHEVTRTNFKKHLATHSGEKPFSCDTCGKTFALKKNLNTHLVIHSDDKPYSCEECGMCFKHRKTLSNHIKTHTGEYNFMCMQCGKKFKRKREMQLHMLCHTGEKPINCPECNRSFARREGLVKHMHIHTGHKPFACKSCNKTFASSQQLKYHAPTHEAKKPYMCTECDKTFARNDRLKVHLATHSGNRPFSCPHCAKGFVRKDNLQCHLNATHGGKGIGS